MLPDGRSLVDTIGTRRFRVLENSTLDGYHTAKVRLDLRGTPVAGAKPLLSGPKPLLYGPPLGRAAGSMLVLALLTDGAISSSHLQVEWVEDEPDPEDANVPELIETLKTQLRELNVRLGWRCNGRTYVCLALLTAEFLKQCV
jgi:hypothetical protein